MIIFIHIYHSVICLLWGIWIDRLSRIIKGQIIGQNFWDGLLGPDIEKQPVVTISVGLAAYHKGEPKESFFQRCDKALYQAKEQGRNQVVQAD